MFIAKDFGYFFKFNVIKLTFFIVCFVPTQNYVPINTLLSYQVIKVK